MIKESNHLSGLAYLATTKLVNIPVSFVARDPSISAHVDAAEMFTKQVSLASEFGQSVRETLKKFVYDLLVYDNGSFLEPLGGGDPAGPIEGLPVSLLHRDGMSCTRTNNPEYPVVFQDSVKKKRYKFHYSRIVFMSQQPSGLQRMNGVGFGCQAEAVVK